MASQNVKTIESALFVALVLLEPDQWPLLSSLRDGDEVFLAAMNDDLNVLLPSGQAIGVVMGDAAQKIKQELVYGSSYRAFIQEPHNHGDPGGLKIKVYGGPDVTPQELAQHLDRPTRRIPGGRTAAPPIGRLKTIGLNILTVTVIAFFGGLLLVLVSLVVAGLFAHLGVWNAAKELGLAWAEWYRAGPLESQRMLWGVHIYWWGRIGKLLTVLAGALLLLEILGAAKIRAATASIRMKTVSIRLMRHSHALMKGITDRFFSSAPGCLLCLLAVVVALAIVVYVGFIADLGRESDPRIGLIAAGSWLWLIAGLIYSPALALGAMAIMGRILSGITEGVATVLERRRLKRILRGLYLCMLVVGLHFDFLAS